MTGRRAGWVAALAVLGARLASAAWDVSDNGHGLHRAETRALARLGDVEVPAAVRFECHEDRDGAVSLELSLGESARLREFHLDDLEGPDAPAVARPLLTVSLARAGGPLVVTGHVAGWYSDATTFVVGMSARGREPSDVRRLLDAVASGVTALELRLADPRDARLSVTVAVPVDGAREAVGAVRRACSVDAAATPAR